VRVGVCTESTDDSLTPLSQGIDAHTQKNTTIPKGKGGRKLEKLAVQVSFTYLFCVRRRWITVKQHHKQQAYTHPPASEREEEECRRDIRRDARTVEAASRTVGCKAHGYCACHDPANIVVDQDALVFAPGYQS
jgi:hypothetical protein